MAIVKGMSPITDDIGSYLKYHVIMVYCEMQTRL